RGSWPWGLESLRSGPYRARSRGLENPACLLGGLPTIENLRLAANGTGVLPGRHFGGKPPPAGRPCMRTALDRPRGWPRPQLPRTVFRRIGPSRPGDKLFPPPRRGKVGGANG